MPALSDILTAPWEVHRFCGSRTAEHSLHIIQLQFKAAKYVS